MVINTCQHHCISITIESLRGVDLTRLEEDATKTTGLTATVSFRGSIANMQIGTFPRLCPISGYPVVESRPVISTAAEKLSWQTDFSHLTLHTTATTTTTTINEAACKTDDEDDDIVVDRRPSSVSPGSRSLERVTSCLSNWSNQKIPEILELRVRLGQSSVTGVCHLIVGKHQNSTTTTTNSMVVHDFPVRSTDAALSKATLRVWVNVDQTCDDIVPPSMTECSLTQSSSSLEEPTMQSRLDLRKLVTTGTAPAVTTVHRRPAQQQQQPRHIRILPPTTARATATSHGCSSTGNFLREFRRAVLACQPIGFVTDDSSTIATQESWDI